ncbi:hypothetical protein RB195_026271 [Necator americanus]|uniref:Uncharacterized protein n=1 Tax=Necator americanus TaxID=51031 RepID=A0ABR1EW93_NECAM
MSTEEVVIFVVLLVAFCFTVAHPFFVAGCIAAFVGYILYFAPKLETSQCAPEGTSSCDHGGFKDISSVSKISTRSDTDGAIHIMPIDQIPKEYERDASTKLSSVNAVQQLNKKSQREILAEIEAAEEQEKFSKLLLTYQVPNMTAYYESLVKVLQK